jgi:hypothetical protein
MSAIISFLCFYNAETPRQFNLLERHFGKLRGTIGDCSEQPCDTIDDCSEQPYEKEESK